jgi:lipopolysaccharide transport system ATP-binding protein
LENNLAIRVTDLSKKYTIGKKKDGSLRGTLASLLSSSSKDKEEFLALKNINFTIEKGEVVGIIGKNGAGKSTLLKILSQITKPSTGVIELNGRIASLLEVGTGFHPELTGRENIFLNGTILGMTRKEVSEKLPEIVEFSGIEKFIDSPVKNYSSGMYVRLAFAVAAHLEPEILVIDEVLAVGDAEFQQKCLGKMKDVAGQGRTVLFVSHNMSAVNLLCQKGIVLDKGEILFCGDIQSAIQLYSSVGFSNSLSSIFSIEPIENKPFQLIEAKLTNNKGIVSDMFSISDSILFEMTLLIREAIPNTYGYIVIKNEFEEFLIESDTKDHLPNVLDNITPGIHTFQLKIPGFLLGHGKYLINVCFTSSYVQGFLDNPEDILEFHITDLETARGHKRTAKTSCFPKWDLVDSKKNDA